NYFNCFPIPYQMISNLSDFSTKSWYNQPVRSRHFLNVCSIGTIPFERSVPIIINCRPLLAHSQSIHSLIHSRPSSLASSNDLSSIHCKTICSTPSTTTILYALLKSTGKGSASYALNQ